MKFRNHLKKVKNVLTIIGISLFGIILMKNYQVLGQTVLDTEVLISFTALIVVLWGEKNNLFNRFWVRVLFIVMILLNIIFVFLGMFSISEYISPLYNFITIVILVMLTFITIRKLLHNQVFNDVFILKYNTKAKLKKLNKNFEERVFLEAINEIGRWSSNNLKTNKDDMTIMTIIDLYEEINNIITKNHYTTKSLVDNKEVLDELRKSYIAFYKVSLRSGVDDDFRRLMLSMLEKFYTTESRLFYEFYSDILLEFVEIDFSISSKTFSDAGGSKSVVALFKRIQKFYKNDNMLNKKVQSYVKIAIIQYRKYSFNLPDTVTILVLQEYTKVILNFSKFDLDIIDVNVMKNLINVLHSECSPRDLNLFYNVQLSTIMDSNSQDPMKLLVLMFNIIDANQYDKKVLNTIVSKVEEKLENEPSVDDINIYVDLLSRLDLKEKRYHRVNPIFKSIKEKASKDRKQIIYDNFRLLIKDTDNTKYLFEELIQYLNNETIAEVFEVTTVIASKIWFKSLDINEVPYIVLFSEILTILKTKHIDDEPQLITEIQNLLETIAHFYTNADSEEAREKIILLLRDNLNSKTIRNQLFSHLLLMGYVDIEKKDGKIHTEISNVIGWHLYTVIENRLKNPVIDELDTIKFIFKHYISFFKEVFNFHNDNSVFVGTVLVVNLAFIERLINDAANEKDKVYFTNIKKHMMEKVKSEFNKNHMAKIKKSFQIRRFSIENYITCETIPPKKIVNDVAEELFIYVDKN